MTYMFLSNSISTFFSILSLSFSYKIHPQFHLTLSKTNSHHLLARQALQRVPDGLCTSQWELLAGVIICMSRTRKRNHHHNTLDPESAPGRGQCPHHHYF